VPLLIIPNFVVRVFLASATIYSLIETAKANDIEPYDYLLHVLKHIASADSVEKLEALLPWNMKSVSKQ
jgi:hypothetical protein